MPDDIKKEKTTLDNVFNQLGTFMAMLQRTPDMKVAVNDMGNMFFTVMTLLKDDGFETALFAALDTEENKLSLINIKAMIIRYKDVFEFEDVHLLTEDEFQMLLQNSLVHPEDSMVLTGMEPKAPEMQMQDMDISQMPHMDMEAMMKAQDGSTTPFDEAMRAQMAKEKQQ